MKKHILNTLAFHDMTVTLLPATSADKLAFRWHMNWHRKLLVCVIKVLICDL